MFYTPLSCKSVIATIAIPLFSNFVPFAMTSLTHVHNCVLNVDDVTTPWQVVLADASYKVVVHHIHLQ